MHVGNGADSVAGYFLNRTNIASRPLGLTYGKSKNHTMAQCPNIQYAKGVHFTRLSFCVAMNAKQSLRRFPG